MADRGRGGGDRPDDRDRRQRRAPRPRYRHPPRRADRARQIVPDRRAAMTNDDVIADVPTEKRRQIEESLAKIREGLLGLSFGRSEEHTSELQSLMRISYAVFCLKKKNKHTN